MGSLRVPTSVQKKAWKAWQCVAGYGLCSQPLKGCYKAVKVDPILLQDVGDVRTGLSSEEVHSEVEPAQERSQVISKHQGHGTVMSTPIGYHIMLLNSPWSYMIYSLPHWFLSLL